LFLPSHFSGIKPSSKEKNSTRGRSIVWAHFRGRDAIPLLPAETFKDYWYSRLRNGVSDKFSGGFGDWARGVAGVKYAIEVELRDRGNLGFVLPVSHIRPVGEEMWSAVRVLARHIVEEKREEYMALTTPGLRTSSFQTRFTPCEFCSSTGPVEEQNSHGVGVIIYRTRTEMLLILGVCAAAILLNLATERLRLTVRVDSSAFVPASDSSS